MAPYDCLLPCSGIQDELQSNPTDLKQPFQSACKVNELDTHPGADKSRACNHLNISNFDSLVHVSFLGPDYDLTYTSGTPFP